ncbi:adenylosuccinate lyase [Sulfitobacter albidus]|uniref:Adenylosuccinate lyase n=1 Tax=Sulfitobacter albidus TaxID=2829501 RepID=A0A975JGY1_9RHOB|nr:carbohydrate-binding module family 14 protein [Sulfitobacter albidus]QUJ78102.1 adenylosuccinate lyase [Sulfitobacter albidus]
MKLKIALATTALMLAPSLALAMGCSGSHSTQAMSCAAGTVYDADSNSCVATTT